MKLYDKYVQRNLDDNFFMNRTEATWKIYSTNPIQDIFDMRIVFWSH